MEARARQNFAENLRLACGYYPSISAVCRRIGMNRQQFNNYLSRKSLPSVANLRRMSDFFGVEESEMFLELRVFSEVIRGKNVPNVYSPFMLKMAEDIVAPHQDALGRSLLKYQGLYHCYYYSCGHVNYVIRSLIYIREVNGVWAVKTIEILRNRDSGAKPSSGFIFKRDGVLILNTSRLFIFDYERAINRTPSLTVLFPSNRSRVNRLNGVHVTVSGGAAQRPFATRVAYQSLGANPDMRAALRRCGLFHQDDPGIPDEIKAAITNEPGGASRVLAALD